MECPNCNKTYDDDFKFCPYCGEEKPEPKICPKCELELNVQFSFCPECGTELAFKSQLEELKREELKREELNKLEEQIREYKNLGKYEKALECYNKAIELSPRHISYWEGKIEELKREELNRLDEQIRKYEKRERYEEAIECYDKLIELEPENISYWEGKLRCLKRLGRYYATKECERKVESLRKFKP